jgi:hypothetical protein
VLFRWLIVIFVAFNSARLRDFVAPCETVPPTVSVLRVGP